MNKEVLAKLYTDFTGQEPTEIIELPASGSNRRYFRLLGNKSIIGALGTCKEENEAFLYMASHFHKKGLPVPKVYAVSSDNMAYIQEDLGDLALFKAIEKGRLTRVFGEEEMHLLVKTLQMLPKIQFEGANGMDFSKCYPVPELDKRSILWDLNYFKYCFLKATGMEFSEPQLEDDFEKMANCLLKNNTNTFLYRDFQSRNVMIKNDEPYFIDFQGGRKGPFYYDVASFLWQAKANIPESTRQELLKEYLKALRQYINIEDDEFYAQLRIFVLFRTLQVLGAYGFRGYFEKKPYFIQSVPYALENLRELLETPFTEFPYLNEMLNRLINLKQFTSELQKQSLTVKVMSFSYKKGIPNDASGNGGGFVFDCRAINNPGKYDRYKPFTGLDECVIKYLEDDGGILEFLDHAYALVDSSVQRYIERGFTNLMVCFGCTGGRHRSVYSAQHMAEHIHKKWNVRVELVHREQNIEEHLRPKRN